MAKKISAIKIIIGVVIGIAVLIFVCMMLASAMGGHAF